MEPILREIPPAGLLLALRNDIAANSELADSTLWFKWGAMAALLHVERSIGSGVDVQTVLDDLHNNILMLQQDREDSPSAAFDIWPIPLERRRYID